MGPAWVLDSWGTRPVELRREEVQAIRLGTGLFGYRVAAVRLTGQPAEPYFYSTGRQEIENAFLSRGWPVIHDSHGRESPFPPPPRTVAPPGWHDQS
jgi:hypothetical protein